jgi:hypothetical protein
MNAAQGSSGIQAVAALQPRVKTLVNFAKSKTWLSTSFSVTALLKLLGREQDSTNCAFPLSHCWDLLTSYVAADDFTAEHWEKFKDPNYYREFRHEVEHDLNVRLLPISSCHFLTARRPSPSTRSRGATRRCRRRPRRPSRSR